MADPVAQQRSRLAWSCRRGRREWDELLLGWLTAHFDAATVAQRDRFAALLELSDPELEHYLLRADHPLGPDLPVPVPGTSDSEIRPDAEPSRAPRI